MLATTNWTGKEEFHKSERKAFWVYNEVVTLVKMTYPKLILQLSFRKPLKRNLQDTSKEKAT